MEPANIRKAQIQDLASIHSLAEQLGYSISTQEMEENVKVILNHPDYELLVITENNLVAGWMSLHVRYAIETSHFLQITGIIVDDKKRGKGYGKMLVNYAEAYANEKGIKKLALYSNNKRTEAHQFYLRQGLVKTKDSSWFAKNLD